MEQDRTLIARLGAHESWARTTDRNLRQAKSLQELGEALPNLYIPWEEMRNDRLEVLIDHVALPFAMHRSGRRLETWPQLGPAEPFPRYPPAK